MNDRRSEPTLEKPATTSNGILMLLALIALIGVQLIVVTVARSPGLAIPVALAIVFVFEPLLHCILGPVDLFFFAERLRFQRAMV